jgi:dienelactone hydrolase
MRFPPCRIVAAALALLAAVAPASAQCPPGGGCTEYLGKAKGSYFRILVPDDWDGDVFLVNHGLELDPLTIAPHDTCKGDPTQACAVDADCAGIGPASCNKISTLGFEQFLLPMRKAVGASTFSETSWAAFHSRFDLKAMIKFLRKKGPGRPKRIIVTGFSGGGAVTVDATMRLKPGKMIHGAIPLCPASAGGTPTVDTAVDVRLVYDFLCHDVPGGSFASLPDVGDPELSQIEFALVMNTCLGWLAPSADPVEAAAQKARLDAMFALTRIPGPNFNLVHVMGFSILAIGDFVRDPARLNGRRPGWNEGLDYASVIAGSAGAAFDAAVARFGPGPGRKRMAQTPYVDFTRGVAKRVNYPILSFAGRADHICPPEFQKVYADAAAYGGKDHATIWGSTGGHCVFTPFELRAVVETYLAWLDAYEKGKTTPTTADVLARCQALPGAAPSDCNFDTAFTPSALADRTPARADWPESARNPLP